MSLGGPAVAVQPSQGRDEPVARVHAHLWRGAGLLAALAVLAVLALLSVWVGSKNLGIGAVWRVLWEPDGSNESTFTDIGTVYILTQGGPFNSTHVLASWAFQVGIVAGDLAQGAAVAVFLVPVLLVAAIGMLRIASRAEAA